MPELTKRQGEVLDFISDTQQRFGHSPTLREIAAHFGFRSPKAAADHLTALQKKGVLAKRDRRARSVRIVSPLQRFIRPVTHIPVYGSIPPGFAEAREQEPEACVSVDVATLGSRPSGHAFALRVRGDSMIGRNIVEDDIVIVEPGRKPRTGDVVAALIDGESTLKTFVMENGKPLLRAENPRYPALNPAAELVIQGVMVALIRKNAR